MTTPASKVVESAETRKPPNAGKGRKKGTPNKVTQEFRETVRQLLEDHSDDVGLWLQQVANGMPALNDKGEPIPGSWLVAPDPDKALQRLCGLAEYAAPKLSRTHVSASGLTLYELVASSFEDAEALEHVPPPAQAPAPASPGTVTHTPPHSQPAPRANPQPYTEQPYLPEHRQAKEAPKSLLETCYRPAARLYDEAPSGPAETYFDPLENV